MLSEAATNTKTLVCQVRLTYPGRAGHIAFRRWQAEVVSVLTRSTASAAGRVDGACWGQNWHQRMTKHRPCTRHDSGRHRM